MNFLALLISQLSVISNYLIYGAFKLFNKTDTVFCDERIVVLLQSNTIFSGAPYTERYVTKPQKGWNLNCTLSWKHACLPMGVNLDFAKRSTQRIQATEMQFLRQVETSCFHEDHFNNEGISAQ